MSRVHAHVAARGTELLGTLQCLRYVLKTFDYKSPEKHVGASVPDVVDGFACSNETLCIALPKPLCQYCCQYSKLQVRIVCGMCERCTVEMRAVSAPVDDDGAAALRKVLLQIFGHITLFRCAVGCGVLLCDRDVCPCSTVSRLI
jgi:hypothetical protein